KEVRQAVRVAGYEVRRERDERDVATVTGDGAGSAVAVRLMADVRIRHAVRPRAGRLRRRRGQRQGQRRSGDRTATDRGAHQKLSRAKMSGYPLVSPGTRLDPY